MTGCEGDDVQQYPAILFHSLSHLFFWPGFLQKNFDKANLAAT